MLVTVINGQVDVVQANDTRDAPMTSVSGPIARKLTLVTGQRLEVIAGVLPAAPMPANLRQATAWQQRQIVFDRRPLGEVADEFNRYNSTPVTISDPTLQRLTISGVFDAYDVDSFAAFLMSLDEVRVDRGATAIAVSRSHDAHAGARGGPANSPTNPVSR
jgi:transmembrane sensor